MKKYLFIVLLVLAALLILGCGQQGDTVDVDSLAQAGADEATLLAVEDAEAELGDDEALVAEGSGAIAGQAVKKAGSKKKAKVEYLSCGDSDSGVNKDIAGYVEVKSTYNGGERSQVIIDRYYSSNGRFYERYCVGNRHRSRVLTCDNGAEEVDVSGRMAWQCSAPPCGNGAVDVGETCSSCPVDVGCGEGQECREGVCVPSQLGGQLGARCNYNEECQSNYCVMGEADSGVCTQPANLGVRCRSDVSCQSGFCAPGEDGLSVCSERNSDPPGARCDVAWECRSGNCTANVCI